MKALRWILWTLAGATALLNACNYDVGECWLRSEETGQGSGAGGPIVSSATGTGAFGDVPPDPQNTTDPPDCDADDEATELGEVHCGNVEWGIDCMIRCGKEGVACYSHFKHPNKPEIGMGLLWKCCGCKGKQACKYIYDNGDECTLLRETGQTLCKYAGGK